jgi:hypothetical protein
MSGWPIRAQVDPLGTIARSPTAGSLQEASNTTDGFAERNWLWRRCSRSASGGPQFHAWFLNATLGEQLSEIRDRTGVAITALARPPRRRLRGDDATEADKVRAKTEVTRTAGGQFAPPNAPQSEMKKKNVRDSAKLKEQGVISDQR